MTQCVASGLITNSKLIKILTAYSSYNISLLIAHLIVIIIVCDLFVICLFACFV